PARRALLVALEPDDRRVVAQAGDRVAERGRQVAGVEPPPGPPGCVACDARDLHTPGGSLHRRPGPRGARRGSARATAPGLAAGEAAAGEPVDVVGEAHGEEHEHEHEADDAGALDDAEGDRAPAQLL